jgi:RNA polymerase sigma factor (TIGR02999 family)
MSSAARYTPHDTIDDDGHWEGGPAAAESLLPLLYAELRKLAVSRMKRESPGNTLQATALVHEAYLRLVEGGSSDHWSSRGHFFAAAAEAMRRILVDSARRRNAEKRGGEFARVELSEKIESPRPRVDLIALSDALDELAIIDSRKAELVKLRYFAGFTIQEAAAMLGIADSTADADWAYAKSWLRLKLRES